MIFSDDNGRLRASIGDSVEYIAEERISSLIAFLQDFKERLDEERERESPRAYDGSPYADMLREYYTLDRVKAEAEKFERLHEDMAAKIWRVQICGEESER